MHTFCRLRGAPVVIGPFGKVGGADPSGVDMRGSTVIDVKECEPQIRKAGTKRLERMVMKTLPAGGQVGNPLLGKPHLDRHPLSGIPLGEGGWRLEHSTDEAAQPA